MGLLIRLIGAEKHTVGGKKNTFHDIFGYANQLCKGEVRWGAMTVAYSISYLKESFLWLCHSALDSMVIYAFGVNKSINGKLWCVHIPLTSNDSWKHAAVGPM